jgi:hypothetical protein
MTHSRRLIRTVVVALAATTLAMPAAHAGPLREPHTSAAGDAATRPHDRGSTARDQDLRHLRAAAVIGGHPLPGPPTWPAHPQPITTARAVESHDDSGVDWTIIAVALAGACLVAGGTAGITRRTRRRTARTRVAA